MPPLKAAQEKLKQANELKTQCDKRLDDVKKANQPKDVAFALVSTPDASCGFNAARLSFRPTSPLTTLKPGAKQELP